MSHVDGCDCPFGEPGSTDPRCRAQREREDTADAMLEPLRQRERERRGSALSDEARFSLLARGENVPTRTHETLAGSSLDVGAVPDGPPEHQVCARPGCPFMVAYDGAEYCGTACFERRDVPVEPESTWAACQLDEGHEGNCGTLPGYPTSGQFTLPSNRCGANYLVRCPCADSGLPGSEGPDPACPEHGRPDIPEDEATPKCPVCRGSGDKPGSDAAGSRNDDPCPECGGDGEAKPVPLAPARDFDDLAAEYGFHGPAEPERTLDDVTPAEWDAASAAVRARTGVPVAAQEERLPPESPPFIREGGKLVYRPPAAVRKLEAEQRRITLKLTLLRSAGILVGWSTGHFSLAEPALDAIIQLVAERDDLRHRLHRAAARCTLAAETISSLAAEGEDESR